MATTSTATATATLLVNGTSTTLLPTINASGAHHNGSITSSLLHSNETATTISTATLHSSSSSSRSVTATPAGSALPNVGVAIHAVPVGVKSVMCLVLGLVAVGFAGL